MLAKSEIEQIIALIKREVVPAIGCTEPVAVALCVAKATETLGCRPEHIKVFLSANILKNAMGVGIPGTGMIGLPIAIALGSLIGKSEYELEVLKDCNPEAVEAGKKMIDENIISIDLKQDITEKLYVEVICEAGDNKAKAIIAGGHTHFIHVSRNEEVLFNEELKASGEQASEDVELNMKKVFEFATEAPLDEIRFILKARDLNKAAAEYSKKGSYGHRLGKILSQPLEKLSLGNTAFAHVLSLTSAACDARMGGAMVPVMSNSGSGNQGITATLPVVGYAEDYNKTEDELVRALTLSHLTVIYIKQSLGRLSALCGCVVAATGSSAGITYLMGGNYNQVTYAIKNMVANITGMICDGAKPSCALKLTSAVSTAMLSAILAMENETVTCVEGIVDDDVDKCIRNMTMIGAQGMNKTDELVLKIMTTKRCD